jgi:peptidoglycan/xylan/chitin deacetylase (PgdA/CDA1 family)
MKSLHLLYHELRALPSDYSYAMECADFERHCELFAKQQQAADAVQPKVTFDDGHRSNYEFALPALEQHGLRAHFFITTGWIGQRAGYMDWKEIRALHAAGQAIGAHGWTHTLLTHCTADQLRHELLDARLCLEDGLGHAVTTMSLPGGRLNRRVLQACWTAGYTEVFTSVPRLEVSVRGPRATVGRLNLRSGVRTEWLERLLQPESKLLATLERRERMKNAARVLLGDHVYAKLWAILNHEERQSEVATDPTR